MTVSGGISGTEGVRISSNTTKHSSTTEDTNSKLNTLKSTCAPSIKGSASALVLVALSKPTRRGTLVLYGHTKAHGLWLA